MDPTSTEEERVRLREVVHRELGPPGLLDAMALQDISVLKRLFGGRKRELTDMLPMFAFLDPTDDLNGLLPFFNEADLEYLQALHRRYIEFTKITADFCKATLYVHPVTGESIQPHREPSTNEKRRIHRALYRLELFRVFFTEPKNAELLPKSEWYFTIIDQSLLCFSNMRTWEIEELACIHDYMIRRYTEIVEECASELSKLYPNKDFYSSRCFAYSFYDRLPNHLYRSLARKKRPPSFVPRSRVLIPITHRFFCCGKSFYSVRQHRYKNPDAYTSFVTASVRARGSNGSVSCCRSWRGASLGR